VNRNFSNQTIMNPSARKRCAWKRFAAIAVVLAGLLETAGCCCINKLMFHPPKDGYDETLPGYIDIGTNSCRIAALVLGPVHGRKAVIRCHGNGEDMRQSLWILRRLAEEGYTVAGVDYPGYGLSDGSPTEEGCYRNVHRLYDWLVEERGFRPEDIIVDGYSIGTGSAVELAATRPVGGLVLEAAFLSAPRVVTRVRMLPIDPFPNLRNITKVRCPILQFHGTADSIVPFSHGKRLFDLAPAPKRFVEIKDGGHVDFPEILGEDVYLDRIRDFAEACASEQH